MSERETQDRVAVDEASAEGSVESQDEAAEPCEQAATESQKEAAAESQETAAESQEEAAGEADGLAELEATRAEAAANYDRYVRAVAELDNYRKRTVRMRAETRDETLRDILLQVAPILDNLRRALRQETQEAELLKQGVELICGQFNDVLKGYGLAEIEALGQPFDPEVHEALAEVPDDEHAPGTVIEEMEKGYKLNDKVVRYARVVVSKASAESTEN
ncbi:MAG: nucleotide exchange factor GrpE [Candidatus Latescibacteria bacterium]|nr:nucleotide exchange factor GrpE [Candidatus Latescibacterota bacterium]